MFHRLSILTVSFIALAICGAVAEARPPRSVMTKVSFPFSTGIVDATFRATPTSGGEFHIAASFRPKSMDGSGCGFGGDCISWRVRGTATGETTAAPDLPATITGYGCYITYSTGLVQEFPIFCEFILDGEGNVKAL